MGRYPFIVKTCPLFVLAVLTALFALSELAVLLKMGRYPFIVKT
jgi:hypothetical protein